MGLKPNWPPTEDQHRYLLILLPAAVVVASLAAFLDRRWWLGWPLRLLLALATARILLHQSIYLEDSAGPGTREWSPLQTTLILGGLAAGLLAMWAGLDVLARRTRGATVWVALAIASAGAAVAVMYSHYATGGQLGVPLAGGLLGAAGAALLFGGPRERGSLGVGVVALFGLLVVGRFFADLTTRQCCCCSWPRCSPGCRSFLWCAGSGRSCAARWRSCWWPLPWPSSRSRHADRPKCGMDRPPLRAKQRPATTSNTANEPRGISLAP